MATPFQRHLGTNYVPSIDEAKDIKKILEASAKEIHDIDIEIDKLEQQLRLLQKKRSTVHDSFVQHQALISPVRGLSLDIIQHIFLACLPTDRNPCMSAAEAPILLTRICSSWRRIAHSIPQLWKAIHIVIPRIDTNIYLLETEFLARVNLARLKLAQRQVAVKEWLNRSRACPLSLSIYQNTEYLPGGEHNDIVLQYDSRRMSFIRDILLLYSERWFEIDLGIPSGNLAGLFEQTFTAQDIQMLEKLHIGCLAGSMTYGDEVEPKWENIAGLLSSRLTSITLSGISVYPSDLHGTPPHAWCHITEMSLNIQMTSTSQDPTMSSTYFSSVVVRHCQSLKTLKLDLNPHDISEPQWSYVEPIILPNLTTLSLSAPLTLETVEFVNCLHIPSVKQLVVELRFSGRDDNQLFHEILGILLRDNGVNLQSFGLQWMASTVEIKNMGQLLQLMPNLQSLKFYSCKLDHSRWLRADSKLRYNMWYLFVNDELLSMLSPSGKSYSDILCPKLEVFECDLGVTTDISELALKEFVKARERAHLVDQRVASLRHLSLYIAAAKRINEPNEEITMLPGNSAVYFRKLEEARLSPWEGLERRTGNLAEWLTPSVPSEVYTYL